VSFSKSSSKVLVSPRFLWGSSDHGSPESSLMNQSGRGAKKMEPIDSMLQHLGTEDNEIDDLVFEKDEAAQRRQSSGWLWLECTPRISSVPRRSSST
jgi:hypothetical protein